MRMETEVPRIASPGVLKPNEDRSETGRGVIVKLQTKILSRPRSAACTTKRPGHRLNHVRVRLVMPADRKTSPRGDSGDLFGTGWLTVN